MNKPKQHQYNNIPKKTRRPLKFVVVGIFLLSAAGGLIYDRLQSQSKLSPVPEPFKYSIQQNVDTRINYRKNSFFDKEQNLSNTAFLTDITDSIDAQFHYNYTSSKATNLTYQYQATAMLRAVYGSDKSSESGRDNVWSKQFILLKPVIKNNSDTSVTINPSIQIPFADYYKQMENFRNAFSAPVNSEMIVTYTVQLTGNINGTPIKETKTSTISVPLDQQIYKVNTQYEKNSKKEIKLANKNSAIDVFAKIEIPLAALLIVAGLGLIVYGFRKQLIKTPHQRKLEKIYRYHDGIIIRAKQPPDLDNKNIVTINRFDDILNLEEELKTPIIASKINDYTTHFIIVRDDIAYVYTLGIPVPVKNMTTSKFTEPEETTK